MKLNEKCVGYINILPNIPVTVTDPCYDKGTWCILNVPNVKPGKYACMVAQGTEHYSFDMNDGTHCEGDDTRVWRSGIWLDGWAPTEEARFLAEEIGTIGVDAGLAGYYQNKPDFSDEEWLDFCNDIHNKDWLIKYNGFCSSSGYGDGGYPVLAYRDAHGHIIGLEIIFVENDEEEEEDV